MAGLIPAIHVVKLANGQMLSRVRLDDVDRRDEPGHDGRKGRRPVTLSIDRGRPKAGAQLALHSRLRVGGKNRPFIRFHSLRHFGAGEAL